MKITKQQYKALEEAMANFKWKKTHAIMTLLKWKWHGKSVPSIKEMKSRVRRLFEGIMDRSADGYRSTGGFTVTVDNFINNDGDNNFEVTISFIVYESYGCS